jgi:hypothetical protein
MSRCKAIVGVITRKGPRRFKEVLEGVVAYIYIYMYVRPSRTRGAPCTGDERGASLDVGVGVGGSRPDEVAGEI